MKTVITILKVLWTLVVIGYAGLFATFTLMGAFSKDASVLEGFVMFVIIFLVGMAPIFLPALLIKFGKKSDAFVMARKQMCGFAIGGAIAWTGWRSLTWMMDSVSLLSEFLGTFLVLYVIGLIVLKINSQISKK